MGMALKAQQKCKLRQSLRTEAVIRADTRRAGTLKGIYHQKGAHDLLDFLAGQRLVKHNAHAGTHTRLSFLLARVRSQCKYR